MPAVRTKAVIVDRHVGGGTASRVSCSLYGVTSEDEIVTLKNISTATSMVARQSPPSSSNSGSYVFTTTDRQTYKYFYFSYSGGSDAPSPDCYHKNIYYNDGGGFYTASASMVAVKNPQISSDLM